MDINIPNAIKDETGSSQIQGSLSFDNENNDNYTIVLPGMHRRINKWWRLVINKGYGKNGAVHQIIPPMFNRANQDHFGVNWTRVPCQQGDVRITHPLIPHGSTGPATQERRTMLPWYMALTEDLKELEIKEAGTFDEVSKAHRDMTAPPSSPSGYPNHYGNIPYRFPAAVLLMGLGSLSDALVGRQLWNFPTVLQERNEVLGERWQDHIEKWRKKAVVAVVKNFQLVKEEEKRAFQKNSYFYQREQSAIGPLPPIDISDPAPDYNNDEWDKYCA